MRHWVAAVLAVCLLRHGGKSHLDSSTEFCTDVRRMYNRCNVYENGQKNTVTRHRGKAGPKGEKGERGEDGAEVHHAVVEQMVRLHSENATLQLSQKYADVKKIIEEHSKALETITRVLNAAKIGSDCSKVESGSEYESSKIYDIYVKGQILPVTCDRTTDGGGWTIIQRRMDGSENFFRNHTDYVKGFGNVSREFWLGLDNIYNILQSAKHFQLRIDMEDWDGVKKFAQYSRFDISGSQGDYTLSVTGYSGDAGDSLTRHSGRKFSTKDRDLDVGFGHCAQIFKGAWWYDNCHYSNLNGLYHAGGPHDSSGDGVNWFHWKGYYYSLRSVEMKIKPLPN